MAKERQAKDDLATSGVVVGSAALSRAVSACVHESRVHGMVRVGEEKERVRLQRQKKTKRKREPTRSASALVLHAASAHICMDALR